MTPSIEEQIKTLRSVGVSDEEICKTLQIEINHIDDAPSLEPVKKPNPTSMAKPDVNDKNHKVYSREQFEEALRMRAEGKQIIQIAIAQGYSASFLTKILKCRTYEEVIDMRKKEATRKRESNADRRKDRKEAYNKQKAEGMVKVGLPQAQIDQLKVLTEIRDQLQRLADNTQKKRWFWK